VCWSGADSGQRAVGSGSGARCSGAVGRAAAEGSEAEAEADKRRQSAQVSRYGASGEGVLQSAHHSAPADDAWALLRT